MSGAGAAFLVERYWPGSSPEEFELVTARLASEISLTGGGVTLLHSTYVPSDDALQWVIRAPSAAAVEALCAAAGVTFERLSPAIESPDAAPG
jgi:hypothetical protein